LNFDRFQFYNRQVRDKCLANWTAITEYFNDEWNYKECKAWFLLLHIVKTSVELLQKPCNVFLYSSSLRTANAS